MTVEKQWKLYEALVASEKRGVARVAFFTGYASALADGAAARVDRLRAAGNGVVPLQGAVALALLLGRAR